MTDLNLKKRKWPISSRHFRRIRNKKICSFYNQDTLPNLSSDEEENCEDTEQKTECALTFSSIFHDTLKANIRMKANGL